MTNLNDFKKLKKLTIIRNEVEQILLQLNNSRTQLRTYLKYHLVKDLITEMKIKESLFIKALAEINEKIIQLKDK